MPIKFVDLNAERLGGEKCPSSWTVISKPKTMMVLYTFHAFDKLLLCPPRVCPRRSAVFMLSKLKQRHHKCRRNLIIEESLTPLRAAFTAGRFPDFALSIGFSGRKVSSGLKRKRSFRKIGRRNYGGLTLGIGKCWYRNLHVRDPALRKNGRSQTRPWSGLCSAGE